MEPHAGTQGSHRRTARCHSPSALHKQLTHQENGEDPDPDFEDELGKLSRDNLKLCEDIAAGIEGPSENEPGSILGSLNILQALRQSSETDGGYSAPPPRAATTTGKASR